MALAVGLAFSLGGMADSMSKAQYQFLEKNLGTEYSAAEAGCDSLAGNAKEVCVTKAKTAKTHELAAAIVQIRASTPDAMANEQAAEAKAMET